MSKRLEQGEFIRRARKIHGKKYGYEAVRYRNIDAKVKINCPKHGYFSQIAWNHIGRPKSGCPKCGDLRAGLRRRSKNATAFVRNARRIHGNKYDYSKAVYKGINTPLCVICPKHGEFWPTFHNHIKLKSRCPKCAKNESSLGVIRKHEKVFIQKSKRVHGDKYDYSKTRYVGVFRPVGIICKRHGLFRQIPAVHLNGNGCQRCGRERLRELFSFSRKEFIKRARKIHGKRFSYLGEYKNTQTPFKLRCPVHGIFYQRPANHLNGEGCGRCSMIEAGIEKRVTHREFLRKVKRIHPRYTFPEKYIKAVQKIKVRCRKHGIFRMTPNALLVGHGCRSCDDERSADRQRLTHDEFLKRCRKIHKDKYRYPEKYKGGQIKIKIRCLKHGLFVQQPNNHLMGNGCPVCFDSSGERKVSRILERMRIRFVRQKKFPYLLHKRPLRFDFWLPYYKTLIEYDGIQHFQASTFFGGKKAYKATKVRDRLKTLWARRMKLPLIRIPYTHPMPEQILERRLGNKG